MPLQESDIQVFINGTKNYFTTVSDQQLHIGTPYLSPTNDLPSQDFTGIIGISGEQKGCVYFTAPRILLRHLLLSLGEKDTSDDMVTDIVGEVANTVSGNARAQFGSTFMISVPLVVQGKPDRIQLPGKLDKAIVIPIQWNKYNAALVACLE
jgi:chemotaxis protein CheX